MNNYYKEELLNLVSAWDVDQLGRYIDALEDRILHTREQITELKKLVKRKKRNDNLKDTGVRGGK